MPSRLALLLDISPRNLERVLYFAQYVIISVNAEACKQRLEDYYTNRKQQLLNALAEIESRDTKRAGQRRKIWLKKSVSLKKKLAILTMITRSIHLRSAKLPLQVLSENEYQQYKEKYGDAL